MNEDKKYQIVMGFICITAIAVIVYALLTTVFSI